MATAKVTKGAKNAKIEQTEARTVLNTVKELDPAKVVTDVSNLQLSVQSTLANLSASITGKMSQIDTIDTAIKLKEERLKELYGIEKEAITLDDMKAQVEALRIQNELDIKERDARWSEEDAERVKALKRASDDWTYEFEQKKKRAQEEFDAELQRQKRAEALRAETLAKEWKEREVTLANRETEFAEMKKQVDGFDARLKTEVAKAEAVLTNVMKRQYEHEKALMAKDAESAKILHESQVSSLQTTIANLNKQVAEVTAQLQLARADAKEVATQALQSASGRQVSEALQRAMDNQSNAPAKGK